MPKTRQQKEVEIANLSDKLAKSKGVVFIAGKGVSVHDMQELRGSLRGASGELQAIKKTLLAKVIDGKVPADQLQGDGVVGLAFSYEDEVAAARVVHTFAKGKDGVRILGGMLESAFIPATSVVSLAQLPGKQELRAMVLRAMQGPATGMVRVLSGTVRSLVTVLAAVRDTKTA